jgi:uncharacterized membrane protein YjjP (DUF1212 family)
MDIEDINKDIIGNYQFVNGSNDMKMFIGRNIFYMKVQIKTYDLEDNLKDLQKIFKKSKYTTNILTIA